MNRHDSTVMWSRRLLILLAIFALFASTVFGMGQSALASPTTGNDIVPNGIPAADIASGGTTSLVTDDGAEAPVSSGGGVANGGASTDKSTDARPVEKAPVASDNPVDAEKPGASTSEDATTSKPEVSAPEDSENSDEPKEQDESEPQNDSEAQKSGVEAQSDPDVAAIQPFGIGPQAAGVAPEILFTEDFEKGSGVPQSLFSYPGTNGIGYTASGYWLDRRYCNGFITSALPNLSISQITNTYCGLNGDPTDEKRGDYNAVRTKAQALGTFANQMDGTSVNAQSNRALSTNTSGGTPDTRMFQSTTNTIALKNNADKRFFAFSVDAAVSYELGVNAAKPEMYFSLVKDGQPPVKLYDPGASIPGNIGAGTFNLYQQAPVYSNQKWASQGSVGRYFSNPFLLEGDQRIGILLENFSTASSTGCGAYAGSAGNPNGCTGNNASRMGAADGNDGAIDNIRVLDVSPTTEKSFSPSNVRVGATSTMTITVNNRSDGLRKDGWEFLDTLPEGLKFANSTVGGTCQTNGQPTSGIWANPTNGLLRVRGGVLNKDQASCTITATVTSDQATTFTNGGPNGNFSGLVGIDAPNDAQVTFYGPVMCTPDSPFLYNQASQNQGNGQFTNRIERYDVTTGQLTNFVDLSQVITRETNGLGISGDGRYFFMIDYRLNSNAQIYRFDAATGETVTYQAAPVGPGNDNAEVRRGAVDLKTGVYYYSTTRRTAGGQNQYPTGGEELTIPLAEPQVGRTPTFTTSTH